MAAIPLPQPSYAREREVTMNNGHFIVLESVEVGGRKYLQATVHPPVNDGPKGPQTSYEWKGLNMAVRVQKISMTCFALWFPKDYQKLAEQYEAGNVTITMES